VNIGGKGRAVTGLIVPPAELAADIDWYAVEASISSKIIAARKLPADWATLDAETKRKLNEEWSKSPEAREAQRQFENRLYFPVRVETGGAFRVDDVPAGIYELTVYLRNTPDGGTRALGGARTQAEFTIPEMPSGRSDDPLDLGKVELKAIKRDPAAAPPR
jgi:hypothetical protein